MPGGSEKHNPAVMPVDSSNKSFGSAAIDIIGRVDVLLMMYVLVTVELGSISCAKVFALITTVVFTSIADE